MLSRCGILDFENCKLQTSWILKIAVSGLYKICCLGSTAAPWKRAQHHQTCWKYPKLCCQQSKYTKCIVDRHGDHTVPVHMTVRGRRRYYTVAFPPSRGIISTALWQKETIYFVKLQENVTNTKLKAVYNSHKTIPWTCPAPPTPSEHQIEVWRRQTDHGIMLCSPN